MTIRCCASLIAADQPSQAVEDFAQQVITL
jgi:hypothetical protein